jgi:hypothetical protein
METLDNPDILVTGNKSRNASNRVQNQIFCHLCRDYQFLLRGGGDITNRPVYHLTFGSPSANPNLYGNITTLGGQ